MLQWPCVTSADKYMDISLRKLALRGQTPGSDRSDLVSDALATADYLTQRQWRLMEWNIVVPLRIVKMITINLRLQGHKNNN